MFRSGKKLSQHFQPKFNLKHNVKNCSGAKDWKRENLAWWMSSDPSRELGSLVNVISNGWLPSETPLGIHGGDLGLGGKPFPLSRDFFQIDLWKLKISEMENFGRKIYKSRIRSNILIHHPLQRYALNHVYGLYKAFLVVASSMAFLISTVFVKKEAQVMSPAVCNQCNQTDWRPLPFKICWQSRSLSVCHWNYLLQLWCWFVINELL